MLQHLLRRLVFDVPILNEYAKMPLKVRVLFCHTFVLLYSNDYIWGDSLFLLFQLLTNHYERCWKYYCLPNGWANFGTTSEEELHLSRKLFWGIFESLAHKVRHTGIKGLRKVIHGCTTTKTSILIVLTEIRCRVVQDCHAMHLCHCRCHPSWLCRCQLLCHGEKSHSWCWGQLWSQACGDYQVSIMMTGYIGYINKTKSRKCSRIKKKSYC